MNGAANHNSIWRGSNITEAWNNGTCSTNIANGTFKDMYLGDYFTKAVTINGTSYTLTFKIVGFDTFYAYASYANVSKHHIAVIVTDGLPNARMNPTNTTVGGYKGSEMFTTTLPTYEAAISDALGASHLVTHQLRVSNAIGASLYNRFGSNTGASSNWEWTGDDVRALTLMSEIQVYGSTVWSSSGYDTGEANQQLPAFKLKKYNEVVGNKWFWLRDVASSSYFCYAHILGYASYNNASDSNSVVPLLLLA